MSRSKRYNPLVPERTDGHLYYVRLKTEVGILYKLGFTTLFSVEERLGYKGTGDEKYIDEILLFHYFENAFEIEQKLHGHFLSSSTFGKFSTDPLFPLCKNGQTELYANDILKLDPFFKKEQMKQTEQAIRKLYEKRRDLPELVIQVEKVLVYIFEILIKFVLVPVSIAVFWVIFQLLRRFEKPNPEANHEKETSRYRDMQRTKEMDKLIEGIQAKVQAARNEK